MEDVLVEVAEAVVLRAAWCGFRVAAERVAGVSSSDATANRTVVKTFERILNTEGAERQSISYLIGNPFGTEVIRRVPYTLRLTRGGQNALPVGHCRVIVPIEIILIIHAPWASNAVWGRWRQVGMDGPGKRVDGACSWRALPGVFFLSFLESLCCWRAFLFSLVTMPGRERHFVR